tara:strand:+ start:65 stop:1492 length:1428 start_codon:yes stop_codon:yes gene_type:complete
MPYGRGKFEAHPNYVRYMEDLILKSPYNTIPDLKNNGRINWQVSSGKTTSFFKSYEKRWEWWKIKADALKLIGEGNSNERFTNAARLLHPTKFKPCRLCGEEKCIGYYYFNKNALKKLDKKYGLKINYLDSVEDLFKKETRTFLQIFPDFSEKENKFFQNFEKFIYLKNPLLSPGYMGNPPDRLDGFHDYCVSCRKKNDPGRSDQNMKMYNLDRRTFEYWVQGNWKKADQLYNSAGSGECSICKKLVPKISPDHVGPLSCGFKHLAFFSPLCNKCNSSKNRRMRCEDVEKLCDYENKKHINVASVQIKTYWDHYKVRIKNDAESVFLSNRLRLIQHFWLMLLGKLTLKKDHDFLMDLINFDCVNYNYSFVGLDKSNLTYDYSQKEVVDSKLRSMQEKRICRIAFDSVKDYLIKDNRKITDFNSFEKFYKKHSTNILENIDGYSHTKKLEFLLREFNLLVLDIQKNDPYLPKTLSH